MALPFGVMVVMTQGVWDFQSTSVAWIPGLKRETWATRHPICYLVIFASTCRRQIPAYLGEDLGYYVARNVGQTEVAALELEGQLGVVHT
jgi:hypothetical protein